MSFLSFFSCFFGCLPPGLATARPLGSAKLAKAPPLGLTRWANASQLPGGEGAWAQLELTDEYKQAFSVRIVGYLFILRSDWFLFNILFSCDRKGLFL